jgi:hypothetical protein
MSNISTNKIGIGGRFVGLSFFPILPLDMTQIYNPCHRQVKDEPLFLFFLHIFSTEELTRAGVRHTGHLLHGSALCLSSPPPQRRPHCPPTRLEQCSRCWEIPFMVGTSFATHEDESARFDHRSRAACSVEAEPRNRRSYQKESSSILPCLPCNHSMPIQRSNSDGRHQIRGSGKHSCVRQISNPREDLLSFVDA